jgi:hypothetical protein
MCLAYVVCASGCASTTAMQTAKPLGKGVSQFSYALSASSLKRLETDTVATTIPGVDVMLRFGMTNHDEVGFRLANFGSFFLFDYKRSLARTKPLYVSAGAAFGAMHFFKDTAGNSQVFDIYLPLYVDLTLKRDVALVFSPKYIFRTEEFHGRQIALSGGVRLGERQGFLIEAAAAQNDGGPRTRYWQVMVSRFKNRATPADTTPRPSLAPR